MQAFFHIFKEPGLFLKKVDEFVHFDPREVQFFCYLLSVFVFAKTLCGNCQIFSLLGLGKDLYLQYLGLSQRVQGLLCARQVARLIYHVAFLDHGRCCFFGRSAKVIVNPFL